MKKQSLITVHTYSLAQLLLKEKTDFPDFRSFNVYKKNRIYQVRNQHLSQVLKKEIGNAEIQNTEYGKPYVLNHRNFAFNHSHSQQHYVLAMSQSYSDIGIDLEDLSRKVRYEALAQHAFHPNELRHWQKLDYIKEYWFKVWTTKEAVLKASGLGIRINLNELDTQADPSHNRGVCHHPAIGYWAYQNFCLAETMLTVAWQSEGFQANTSYPNIEIIAH